ncbi:hypothetical protein EWI07_09750 [Sporolactobacillus sp. THM7-4]|nr:hypothetical protein EWI07_09750 [Sporolactobacillus sp. THM7-4]
MKKMDWFFSLFLIIAGLTCLLFSATGFGHESILAFGRTFFKVCMWFICPVIIFVCLSLWVNFRNKK